MRKHPLKSTPHQHNQQHINNINKSTHQTSTSNQRHHQHTNTSNINYQINAIINTSAQSTTRSSSTTHQQHIDNTSQNQDINTGMTVFEMEMHSISNCWIREWVWLSERGGVLHMDRIFTENPKKWKESEWGPLVHFKNWWKYVYLLRYQLISKRTHKHSKNIRVNRNCLRQR